MTKIVFSKDLISELNQDWLFLDTTTFIAAINYQDEFSSLFHDLKLNSCEFLTIPSVLFEFTRGSNTKTHFNTRTKFVNDLANIFPIERHLEKLETEIIIAQKFCSTASYTDFLLVMCLIKFPQSFLITENHKDMPMALLERKHIITLDTNNQIRNQAIYQVNQKRYQQQLKKITRSKS